MGFFSWLCKGCGKSILNPYAITKTSGWMNRAIALGRDGSRHIGDYDGYGRLISVDGETELMVHGDPEIWHYACWKKSGRPDFSGPSKGDPKQGHFVGNKYDNESCPNG